MDCLFNQRIPKSKNSKIIIPPEGKTFISGFAQKYKTEYPQELEFYKISKEEYADCINDINELIEHYWPCRSAFLCGYLFIPCTLCLSLFVPNYCVSGAEQMVRFQIRQGNRHLFEQKGLKMKLVKSCSTSWLEIEQFDDIDKIATIISAQRNQTTAYDQNISNENENDGNQLVNDMSNNHSLMSDFNKV